MEFRIPVEADINQSNNGINEKRDSVIYEDILKFLMEMMKEKKNYNEEGIILRK